MRSIVTGASGFIGQRLCDLLRKNNLSLVGCFRTESQAEAMSTDSVVIEDIVSFNQWDQILRGDDVIIHLAARAHILSKQSNDSNVIDAFRVINRDATLRLAEAAVCANVKRFVYVSSIGVLGNSTIGCKFDNHSEYNPKRPYSISKMEAEIGLRAISESSNLEVVIVRPPLVFGPNAPGNFHRLIRLVGMGLPMPLGGMHAKKSMISLDNLCDLLMTTITAHLPKFTQMVLSDGSDWSTSELVALIAKYMGNKRPLFYVPMSMLMVVASLIGKKEEIRKLSVPLQVVWEDTVSMLNWSPVQSPEDGVKDAVEYYLNHKSKNNAQLLASGLA